MPPAHSRLFYPCKAVGLITSDKPFELRFCHIQDCTILKVPVGNVFHIYSTVKLKLMNISCLHRSRITCMVSGSPCDFTGTEDGLIYCFSALTHLKKTWKGHKCEVHQMTVVGDFLVSIDVENNLKVWSVKTSSIYLEMEYAKKSFHVTVLMHPATYLNKVLLGSKQGQLKLFNFKTSKELYTFSGWKSEVTVIEQAPSLDIVAIGLDNGNIVIHNIKLDETIFTLKQDWGRVTALSFRSDNNSRLLSGSMVGHIAVWDLENKCLSSIIEHAHNGPIISLRCLQGDPFAQTSSTDNVLKTWVFDMSDGGGRLYCMRDGHSQPPLKVRFHGERGDTVLSGGRDCNLRMSNLNTLKGQSFGFAWYSKGSTKVKLSAKTGAVKMPPIINFVTEYTKEECWDNVAAIHLNTPEVTTWSTKKTQCNERKLLNYRFQRVQHQDAMAMCIDITGCGNFVVIGFDSGHIDRYNMESGLYKMSYHGRRGAPSAIRGIVTDALNHWVVSGHQDGKLQWWGFHSGTKDKTLKLEGGVYMMNLHRESGLFAIALDDWSLQVADIDTKCIVRKLYGHESQVTDLGFSSDSKWLVSSSMDCSIRTWDLPSGSCIDNFLVPTPATSIALSPIDDFLVSTHVDEVGVYVWANRNCFSFVSLQPLKEDHVPVSLVLPGSAPDLTNVDDESDESEEEDELEVIDEDAYVTPEQISDKFITIDLMPTSRWLSLLKIDQIKERSKPIEAAKVPKSAPFFLESVAGIEAKLNENPTDAGKSKLISRSQFVLESLSHFGQLLKEEKHTEAFEIIKKMNATRIDMEIRNLDPDVGGSRQIMIQFLEMIKDVLKDQTHFEVAQGYLGLFMKRHPDFMTNPDPDVEALCDELADLHKKAWHVLKDDINKSLCLLSYFKNSAILNY